MNWYILIDLTGAVVKTKTVIKKDFDLAEKGYIKILWVHTDELMEWDPEEQEWRKVHDNG